jgi:SOS response regulatory protein OraA/RecX
LDKKKIVPGELSYEEKEKITAMLLRKGFSFDAVKHILNGREY